MTHQKVLQFLKAAQANIGYKSLAFNESEYAKIHGYPGSPWNGAYLETARLAAGLGGPALTSSTAALAWFTRKSRLYRRPKPGDVAFFAFSTQGNFAQPHIALVTEVQKHGFFRVLEGQSGRDENQILANTWHTQDTIGFGRLPTADPKPAVPQPMLTLRLRTLLTDTRAIEAVQVALGEVVHMQDAQRGRWDTVTRTAYFAWQRECGVYGLHGKPDRVSLRRLADVTGRFHVAG